MEKSILGTAGTFFKLERRTEGKKTRGEPLEIIKTQPVEKEPVKNAKEAPEGVRNKSAETKAHEISFLNWGEREDAVGNKKVPA